MNDEPCQIGFQHGLVNSKGYLHKVTGLDCIFKTSTDARRRAQWHVKIADLKMVRPDTNLLLRKVIVIFTVIVMILSLRFVFLFRKAPI